MPQTKKTVRKAPAMVAADGPAEWLSKEQAAEHLKVKPRTLEDWRHRRRGPAFYRPGGDRGRVLYRVEDLDAYVAAARVEPVVIAR